MVKSVSLSDVINAEPILVLQAHNGEMLSIPGEAWLLKADFTPQGPDLLLTGEDGVQIVVRDFFNLEVPPDLVTEAGAIISAELAVKLAGPTAPGQFALLENGPFAQLAQAAESIGRVEETDGVVEAIRVDGTKVPLAKGDDIFQGDTLVTGEGAAVGIVFIDETTFSLGEEGRMVIDELVYDPDAQDGAFGATLVQGVFTFVSGEIAKTAPDAMTLSTPIATIGIRGTKVAGRAGQEGAENTFSLLPEFDPFGNPIVGEVFIGTQGGTVILNAVGATVQMTSAFDAPPPPVVFSPEQIQQNFGGALTTLSTTVAAKAQADAEQNAEEAAQAEAEAAAAGEAAAQAEAEAAAAAAEAEAAAAEAAAALAAAEASGDDAALAEAEAAALAAEQAAAEAAAAEQAALEAAAQAEAAAAEAEAAIAEAIAAEAVAQFAAAEMQAQAAAFAEFGGGPLPGGPDDGPAEGDVPPEGGPQDGPGPDDGAIEEAAAAAVEQAIAEGATPEEAAIAGFEAAAAQALAEGASPEEIAAAEAAYAEAIANGASPEEALALAGAAAQQVSGFDDGGFGDDQGTDDGLDGGFDGGFDSGSSDPFSSNDPFSSSDPFSSGGDLFGSSDPFGGDDLFGDSGDDIFEDPFAQDGGSLDFGFSETGDDSFLIDFGGDDGSSDPDDPDFNPDDPTTIDTFSDFPTATTGNDNLTGGSGDSQFIMTQGVDLGGSDVLSDQGGTDEMAFNSMDDLLGIFDAANQMIYYSTSDGSITGDIDLGGAIEQLSASDGIISVADASAAGAVTGSNGVRLEGLHDVSTGYGYIIAGTDSADASLTLANSTFTGSYSGLSSLSHTITTGNVIGSIMFGRGGNDTITGSEAGDTIFGGDGFDTIDGGGTTSDDGDVLVGGGGNDTFNMSSTSLSDSIIVGGTGTDEVLYDGYAGDITFDITSASVSTTHDSTVSEAITGVENLLGVSNASYTNTFNFSGDTTSQGVLAVNGGVNDDTFNLTSGSTTAMDIDAEAGDDIFNIGANAAFTGTTITGGSGNDTFNVSALALDGATRAFNGGSNAADILNITASSDVNLSATEMNGATLFETFRFQSGVNYNVTLGANNIANGASTSITASGSTSMVLDAELETDGDFGYTGSAGTDQLTVATAMLDDNNSHSLNGNTGTDTIYFAGTAATNLDATEIGSVVNFENWVLDDDANYTFTLGSGNATTATFTINATTVTTQTVTIDATAESSETIDYTGGTGIDQLTVSKAMLSAAGGAADLSGGGGSSDILTINGTGTLSSAALANISGWETWTLTGAAKTLTTVEGNFASGITTTVSASSMTGNVDLNASAETDGTLSYSGSAGIDTVIGGDGADILVGNNGDDVFTGGDGGDTLTGNAGNDTFTYTAITDGASANSVSGYDTITDFVAGSESFTISGTFATAIDDVTADSSLTWGTVSGSPVALDFSGTKEAIRIDTAAGLSVGDLTTSGWSSVLSVINTGNTITSASGIDALILANDGTNSALYYYLENGSVTTTVEASELSLVAFASNATMTETDVDLA